MSHTKKCFKGIGHLLVAAPYVVLRNDVLLLDEMMEMMEQVKSQ